MMCARCDKSMTSDEAEGRYLPGSSGAGYTVWVHKQLCKRPPQPRTYSYSPRTGN